MRMIIINILLGVITAIVLLLIAAWTTKRPNTDDQHK